MQLATHKLIGEHLYNHLNQKYGQVLHRDRFIRGNLLPDLDRNYMAFCHYKEDCWDYLATLMVSFYNRPFQFEKSSEILGVICHFVSDIFCKVHNKPYQNQVTIIGHVIYEYQLHRRFSALAKSHNQGNHSDLGYYVRSLGLAAIHSVYLAQAPSMEHDIEFALSVCTGICEEWLNLITSTEILSEAIA